MSRFQITIDGCEYDEDNFTNNPEDVAGEWAMLGLVEEWIQEHHNGLRGALNHQVSDLETTYFEVEVTDEDDAEASKSVYVQPDEPDDADGDWEYMGCYNSVEYSVCESLTDGEAQWWKIDDNSKLGEMDGVSEITYTQNTPERFDEEEEEEEEEENETKTAE
jgi:hypothetical protein